MKIVMTGGGSGGHITPILAVAHELKRLNTHAEIIYIGQRGDALADIPANDPNIDAVYTVSAGKFRVPDVTILDRNLPVEQVITRPPIAVVEILSPEDTLTRMMTKLNEYQQMGIQTILVIDPDGSSFRFTAGSLEPLPAEAFDLPGSVCRFDFAEIKKLLD